MSFSWRQKVLACAVIIWSTSLYAQIPDTLWTRTYGSTGDDKAYSVQQTMDSGFIMAGYTRSFGAGDRDYYLVKTNPDGDTLWTRRYGGSNEDFAYGVIQTSDQGYIISGIEAVYPGGIADGYIIKTDSLGAVVWSETYGGSDDDICTRGIEINDGCSIVVGSTESYGINNSYDVWLLKIDAQGNTVWTRTYGDSDDEFGMTVEQTSDGGYFITGTSDYSQVFLVKTDTSGNPVWTTIHVESYAIGASWGVQTPDRGYIVVGDCVPYGPMMPGDLYVAKFDTLGNFQWSNHYGTVNDDEIGRCVQRTSGNGYILAGYVYFNGSNADVYVVKTDSLGALSWSKSIGGPAVEWCFEIQKTSDNGYILGGYTGSFGAGGWDYYLIRLGSEQCAEEQVTASSTLSRQRLQISPNPCKHYGTVEYCLASGQHVKLTLYDVTGKAIRTLLDTYQDKGRYSVPWQVRDAHGCDLLAGTYFCELRTGRYTSVEKILVVR